MINDLVVGQRDKKADLLRKQRRMGYGHKIIDKYQRRRDGFVKHRSSNFQRRPQDGRFSNGFSGGFSDRFSGGFSGSFSGGFSGGPRRPFNDRMVNNNHGFSDFRRESPRFNNYK